MGRLNYGHVLRIESETTEYSRSYLAGVAKYFPLITDTLFQLMYFTGPKDKDAETEDGSFASYCWHQYYHSGYSLRATFILYEKGYYLEANIILRRLLELLIKMRYLENHKNLIGFVWTDQRSLIKDGSKKPRILDMFNEVAPNLYKNFYGLLLSGFTHGGIGSAFGKIDYKNAKESEVSLGPVWNEETATFYVNTFTMIALGYLKYFPTAFKDSFPALDTELLKQYEECVDWLKKSLDDHKLKYPHSIPWHDAMKPII